jgi:23S rRNA (uracil1939-C5)-methyltransferase
VVALVLRVLDPPAPADLERMAAFERKHSVRIYLQPGGPDTIAPLDPAHPPASLSYRLTEHGVAIDFEPTDFVQINGALNRAMIARALEVLEPQAGETVRDSR